jgi:hypothetical protein
MKKIFIILFFLFAVLAAHAQVFTTSLTLNQPPAAVSEWISNNNVINYLVTNPDIPKNVVIKAELKTISGDIVATKDLMKAQVYSLKQGVTIFYGRDVMPLETMVFSPAYAGTLEKTGKLPSGMYQLEVRLVLPQSFQPLTTLQVKTFNLAALQLPILLLPVDRAELDAKAAETAITFRWTPLSPRLQYIPRYRVQVFQVLSYQEPLQALRGNPALLDMIVQGQTQYIWRPQLPFMIDSTLRKFIWTIQTLDAQGQPVIMTDGNGESRSEPRIFFIKEPGKSIITDSLHH